MAIVWIFFRYIIQMAQMNKDGEEYNHRPDSWNICCRL